jgi:hypothetical protein
VQLCFDFYMIEAKPENLIGDCAYETDPFDEELRRDGIEMIAPHRANRSKPSTRRLSRFRRRWLVGRFFAWIQWQRRILVRWEYHTENFLGFVTPPRVLRSTAGPGGYPWGRGRGLDLAKALILLRFLRARDRRCLCAGVITSAPTLGRPLPRFTAIECLQAERQSAQQTA